MALNHSDILYWPQIAKLGIVAIESKIKKYNIETDEQRKQDVNTIDYESRVKNGWYDGGVAARMGWTIGGEYYAIGIDLDGWHAVKAWFDGITDDDTWLNVLNYAENNRVEWHQDKTRLHLIMYVREFGIKNTVIPITDKNQIEIHGQGQLLRVSPSIHQDGNPFVPIDSGEIPILDSKEKFKELQDKINSLSTTSYIDNNISTSEWLHKPDTIFKEGGGRHNWTVWIVNSYFRKYKDEWLNLTDDERFNRAWEWHLQHCDPPRDRDEFDKICDSVVNKFKKDRDKLHSEVRSKNKNKKSSSKKGEEEEEKEEPTILSETKINATIGKLAKYYVESFESNFAYFTHANGIDKDSVLKIIDGILDIHNITDKTKCFDIVSKEYSKDFDTRYPPDYSGFAALITERRPINTLEDLMNLWGVIRDESDRIQTHYDDVQETYETIMEEKCFVTVKQTNEIYGLDNGVFLPQGDILIGKRAEILWPIVTAWVDQNGLEHHQELSIATFNEIKGHIMRRTYHELEEFDSDINLQNFKNGLYHIMDQKFTPHDDSKHNSFNPPYLSFNQKPVIYNPKARPKMFLNFLREVTYKEDLWPLIQLMSYTFYPQNPYEIITILHGGGSNGKSVIFLVLTGLHGIRNVSNVSLDTIINNRFGLFDMLNKSVNLDAELSSGVIEDTALLKKLTGRQSIRVEQKNQKAFDAFLHAKLWLSANEIPQTSDQTDAYYRRNVVISFPKKFEPRDYDVFCKKCRFNEIEDNRILYGYKSKKEMADREQGIYKEDNELPEKLTTEEELSGILNIMMRTLRIVLKNKRIITNEKTIQERKNKYEMAANPVGVFLRVAVSKESTPDDYTIKDDSYKAYRRYCNYFNLPIMAKDKFCKIVKRDFEDGRIREDKDRIYIWKGMRLVDEIFTDKYITNKDSKQDTLDKMLGKNLWEGLI